MISNVKDSDYKAPLLINGTIKSANYNSIEYLWGEITEYNCIARDVFLQNINNFPYVQDAYTPTAIPLIIENA